jgi:GMP synthase (glutamine-hydrolysing)
MQKVIVLDFGSQYTQLIARRVRELSVYSEIYPFDISIARLKTLRPDALIFSGGPASVYDKDAPTLDPEIYNLGLPILGICYGLQLIAKNFGGSVEKAKKREFGRAEIAPENGLSQNLLFKDVPASTVWMSHSDKVTKLPEGFDVTAETASAEFCGTQNVSRNIYGVQFHPEVHHSAYGKQVLSNFLFEIAKLKGDWSKENFIQSQIEKIRDQVGKEKVICGLSGGVDSTVAAVLINAAIGKQLRCVFVDNGLLRKNEAKQVRDTMKKNLNLNLTFAPAEELFLSRLKKVVNPETKRKIIGKTFIDVFEKNIRTEKFLAQGTIYPDVIESSSHKGVSQTIKSHHNVGGLPKRMKLSLVEPFRELFKDEVREVGKILNVPDEIIHRHPFPGPGLAIRVLGEVTKSRLDLLREADDIFISELKSNGLYDSVWQAFAVLLPVQAVGVMGDNRTYENVLALRAVGSVDGMTADWSALPYEFLATVSNRIINEVRGVNRVTYDISSKPPATIEWE